MRRYMTDKSWLQTCKLLAEWYTARRKLKDPDNCDKLWDILYMDGYGSHVMCPEALRILKDAQIYAIAIPSHTSHVCQMLNTYVALAFSQHIYTVYCLAGPFLALASSTSRRRLQTTSTIIRQGRLRNGTFAKLSGRHGSLQHLLSM